MSIFKTILDNQAKLTVGVLSTGRVLITVVCEDCFQQQQVTPDYINATSSESQELLVQDMIKKCKKRAERRKLGLDDEEE